MELEVQKVLEEKLLTLKKFLFDNFTKEYNTKFCKRNYQSLKYMINQYKNAIDDIDSMIEKYCNDGWMYI